MCGAQVCFFPAKGQCLTVRIRPGGWGQSKRRGMRNCVTGSGVHHRRIISCGDGDTATAAGTGRDKILDIFITDKMKISVAIGLKVIDSTNTGVSHNGRTAAWLVCSRTVAIGSRAIIVFAVKRMIGVELVTYLMCDEIHVKRITGRTG